MRSFRLTVATALSAAATGLIFLATAAPAGAAVSISAPTSANLGSAPVNSTSISGKLGTVTATATGTLLVLPSFKASVSTTVFTTGAGGAGETIGKESIFYWSGPATASSGLLSGGVPGQLTAANAVDLTVTRTAFSGQGTLASMSVSWNPTIVINVPASAVAGTYRAVITHSVA